MTDRPPSADPGPAAPASRVFRQFVALALDAGARPAHWGASAVVLVQPDGDPLLAVEAGPGLADLVARFGERLGRSKLRVVVFAPDLGWRGPVANRLRAERYRRRIHVFGIDPEGGLWKAPGASPGPVLPEVLARIADAPGAGAPAPEDLARRLAESRRAFEAEQADIGRFRERLAPNRAVATPALLALMVVAWLGEEAWGGSHTTATLTRMGAAIPGGFAEPWRLLTPAFLHAGIVHLAFNGFALWNLGRFFERLVGTGPTVAVLLAAAVGGNAAAMAAGDAVMIGASTALWGLLVALAWVAWRRGPQLPAPMRRPLRNAARANLLLCLVISFFPGISLLGHLGGALGGLLAVLALRPEVGAARSFGWRVVEAASAVGIAVSLRVGLLHGQPWKLMEPAKDWTRVTAPGGALSVELPADLAASVEAEGPGGLAAGDITRDAAVIEVLARRPGEDAGGGLSLAGLPSGMRGWTAAGDGVDVRVVVDGRTHPDADTWAERIAASARR